MRILPKSIKGKITCQIVFYIILAIVVCEAVSVNSLSTNMTKQTRNYVQMQAEKSAGIVDEWLKEQGNIVHTLRDAVSFMDTKDTNRIMDYLEANLSENEDALMYYVCFAYDGGVFRLIIPNWIWIQRQETGGHRQFRKMGSSIQLHTKILQQDR